MIYYRAPKLTPLNDQTLSILTSFPSFCYIIAILTSARSNFVDSLKIRWYLCFSVVPIHIPWYYK